MEDALELNKLAMSPMLIYNAETSSGLPAQITDHLPADESIVFYSTEQDINILFYVEDANESAVIWIDGEKYPFSYGYGYSPMESEAPLVGICDINSDGTPDIFVYGVAYRTELRQDVYLSDGLGGYKELGDVTWNKRAASHSFSFHASYVEGYQVRITAPDWNIDETRKIEETLAEQLLALGIYDEQGNVTEYGKSWEITHLQGESVAYVQDKDGNARLYYEAQVEAGYSEYTLGYGFRFEYLITDAGYELENVVFIVCVE